MSNRHLWGAIEALLFASGQPLPPEKIAGILNISIEEVHTLTNDMATSMADENGA